jgi:predicted exporter
LAVAGRDIEQVLQTEEKISHDLDSLNISYRAISGLIPSQKNQQENRHLVELQLYKKYYAELMKTFGVEKIFNSQNFGFDQPLFILDKNSVENLPTGWHELVHYDDNGTVTGRIILDGVIDNALINHLVLKYPGVSFIDPVYQYSQLFASYRVIMMILIAVVLFGFTVLLTLRNNIKIAFSIVSPIMLSILASIGIIALLGPFTLFHAMGFMLVLCIGIDYALFIFWIAGFKSDGRRA